MWEEEGKGHVVTAQVIADDGTILEIEVRGLPLDLIWAYGAGWQVHLEDLGYYLAGRESLSVPTRWDELEAVYRDMTVTPL